jgi:hypothetical protein
MGCNCGKKKGGVSVFSTEEQARIARERNVKVVTAAGRTNWSATNTQTEEAKTS